ncbi:MAG: hypothetical protein LBV13_01400 [Methanomassiliicoccaceae archaeon]|nr:hypothetical protein [Methanomassiliicoccaceae archaeon]
MNKKAVLPGIAIAAAVVILFSLTAVSGGWFADPNDSEFVNPPYSPDDDGNLQEESIPYQLFENYGPVLLILALLMFGAIIGGVQIAKEDDDDDTD